MAEKHSLTAPIILTSILEYSVIELNMRFAGIDSSISIGLVDNVGRKSFYNYDGINAQTQLTAPNKANLTSNSLQRRILTRLFADGLISAGTIIGVPD